MKHKLLPILFCLAQTILLAQSIFSVNPNPAYTVSDDSYEAKSEGTIKNLSSNTETFRWTRTIIRLDDSQHCQIAIGDPIAHYPPNVSTHTFPLNSGEEGPLQVLLFDTEGSGCCAIVNLRLYPLSNTADTLDALFYLRECQVLSAPESLSGQAMLSPNPVGDYFSLQNAPELQRMDLFDTGGRQIRSIPGASAQHYWCGDLPAGGYFLVLRGQSGVVLQVLEMSKK